MRQDYDIKERLEHFYKKKVKEVMDIRHWDLPIIEKEAPLEDVLTILSVKDRIWVVDNTKDKNLYGIITDKNFFEHLLPPRIPRYGFFISDIKSFAHKGKKTAETMMTKHLIKCHPETTIKDVIIKMKKYQIKRLPITKNGKIIGEITLQDIIRGFASCILRKTC